MENIGVTMTYTAGVDLEQNLALAGLFHGDLPDLERLIHLNEASCLESLGERLCHAGGNIGVEV